MNSVLYASEQSMIVYWMIVRFLCFLKRERHSFNYTLEYDREV